MASFEPSISQQIELLRRKTSKKTDFIKSQKEFKRIHLLSNKMSKCIDKITKNQVINIIVNEKFPNCDFYINLRKVHNKFGIINTSSNPLTKNVRNFKKIKYDYLPLNENFENSKNNVS